MKSLVNIVEGILSNDYDITDSTIMPGVKNWPQFIGRLEHFGKWEIRSEGDTKYMTWPGLDLQKALTAGIKNDIGPNIRISTAKKLIPEEGVGVIGYFKGYEPDYFPCMCIGISDSEVYEFYARDEYTRVSRYKHGFMMRLRTIDTRNWGFKKIPDNAYNIIKQKLNLP